MAVTPLVRKDGTQCADYKGETPLDELVILLAKGKDIIVVIDGAVCNVNIKPFAFSQLPEVLKVTAPIFETLKTEMASSKAELKKMVETKDFSPAIQFISDHTEQTFNFIHVFEPAITVEQLRTMTADNIAELVLTIVEVNLDFFTKKLTPTLLRSMGQLAQQMPKFGLLLAKN